MEGTERNQGAKGRMATIAEIIERNSGDKAQLFSDLYWFMVEDKTQSEEQLLEDLRSVQQRNSFLHNQLKKKERQISHYKRVVRGYKGKLDSANGGKHSRPHKRAKGKYQGGKGVCN